MTSLSAYVVSNHRIGMAGLFSTHTHRLTESDLTSYFQDGGHDVISRRKVLLPDEWRRCVCSAPIQHRPPVPDL